MFVDALTQAALAATKNTDLGQDEFVRAENAAGFRPKPGCGPTATGGFGTGGSYGRVESFWPAAALPAVDAPPQAHDPDALLSLADEALEAAQTLRDAFPDSSWQHSTATADAADGLDERLARYREQRAKYDRMLGRPLSRPSAPQSQQRAVDAPPEPPT